jgi:taurine-pyruvate aminotransferase
MDKQYADLIEQDKAFMWHHLVQHKPYLAGEPPVYVKAKGCTLTNIHGKEYLDAVSGGVWCVNVGYGRESMAKAVYDQLCEMPYYALSAGNVPAIKLAKKIAEMLPERERKVFFSNSGSEANEKAFKMARLYGRVHLKKDKYKIIYRHRDYHGTTLAALSATGQEERRMGFGPLVPGFEMVPESFCYRCPFNKTYPGCDLECATVVEKTILEQGPDSVAAFIVEPITAGGGILEPVKEYFPKVQEICRKYDVLLIMDEVVCGFGRTGKWFGHQHFDVQPDIITMAKGMASSYLPLSATVAVNEVYNAFVTDPSDKFGYFRDISTYGGCAGSCAAGFENVRIIEEENLLQRVADMGDYLLDQLRTFEDMPKVGQVRGRGLFAGIEFVEDKKTKTPVDESFVGKVLAYAFNEGVLLGRMNRSVPGLNNVLTLAPAYIVTKEEIDRIVATMKKAILAV